MNATHPLDVDYKLAVLGYPYTDRQTDGQFNYYMPGGIKNY
jgi:hypothetical protein